MTIKTVPMIRRKYLIPLFTLALCLVPSVVLAAHGDNNEWKELDTIIYGILANILFANAAAAGLVLLWLNKPPKHESLAYFGGCLVLFSSALVAIILILSQLYFFPMNGLLLIAFFDGSYSDPSSLIILVATIVLFVYGIIYLRKNLKKVIEDESRIQFLQRYLKPIFKYNIILLIAVFCFMLINNFSLPEDNQLDEFIAPQLIIPALITLCISGVLFLIICLSSRRLPGD